MSAIRSRRLLSGLAAALLCSTSAFAADGEALGQRLKDLAAAQDMVVNYTAAETNGDDVVLKGLTVGPADSTVNLGDVTFETVTGTPEDGFKIERVALADVESVDDTSSFHLGSFVGENIVLQGTVANADALPTSFYMEKLAISDVAIRDKGEDISTIAEITADNTITAEGNMSGSFVLTGLVINTEDNENTQAQAASQPLAEMGYSPIRANMNGSAEWHPGTGMLTLDPMTIELEDGGKLDFTYTINGYTPAFIQQLQQLQQQMAAAPENNEGAGMAMLGLMSQIQLINANLAFTDDSLTPKLLDYFAGKSGQSRTEFVNTLSSQLPMLLAQLQNPEFQTKVSDAVTQYLNDPKNITISIAPPAPVPATQIIGAAVGAPQTLPQVLNLDVISNQ
ncbi:hypothetical protein FPY71_06845 [Aureimonas fodinaquatilis]|uniref:DUF945 domain-containing protein n=1 Tax=Aureimonas fodinaquatilis TaxID=2565783 RepID=A0A5B0DW66_9HYPH|nr:hypothetical protein [Aureimonas fodinaquatilis]KAA0970242.1 hypothetical protein FPY71_06845 [Aureimonas fodinaquatilis]